MPCGSTHLEMEAVRQRHEWNRANRANPGEYRDTYELSSERLPLIHKEVYYCISEGSVIFSSASLNISGLSVNNRSTRACYYLTLIWLTYLYGNLCSEFESKYLLCKSLCVTVELTATSLHSLWNKEWMAFVSSRISLRMKHTFTLIRNNLVKAVLEIFFFLRWFFSIGFGRK